MYSTPTLATRFARNTRVMRGDQPLSEDQMRAAAPSIFAEGKHASRSERYTYIPTIDVLRGLRKEGFEPFMVAQGASRVEGKAEFTKHMIRMRHAGQVEMRITREDHCLFLLDEPDTHLNPIWKLRYFDDIERVLDREAGGSLLDDIGPGSPDREVQSQVLITTHDPMMVGSLKREQVHILRRQDQKTLVDTPDVHPQGMGVTGLLKSELFGLTSTLDVETERRLARRNELYVKQPRTAEEDADLTRLSAELSDLGFSTADFRDPDYALFVRKMAEHRKFRKPTISPEEQAEQEKVADEIIDEILREEDGK